MFVSGASAGMGAALAVKLEKLGSRLVLGARRLDRLNALRATFQLPGEHLPVDLDVTNPDSVAKAFASAEAKYGKLDALVANAGVGGWFPVHATPEAEMRRIFDTNVFGVVRCIRGAVPLLEKAGGGRLLLVSSVVGRRGIPGMGIYSASKFALHGLADAMRVELEERNITVSTICPGLTRSEFFEAGTGAKGSLLPSPRARPPRPSPTELWHCSSVGSPRRIARAPSARAAGSARSTSSRPASSTARCADTTKNGAGARNRRGVGEGRRSAAHDQGSDCYHPALRRSRADPHPPHAAGAPGAEPNYLEA